ncbi:hypothetical protein GH5_06009 [Leishmania sp. Ghana 2012 LV757]|uniref:hypothetical protein n=1 Tax=Leishmania sp. Ghana 2012 LV757 TaxID=2803181 RepID=UPI001B4D9E71|nr:hypothetical protein GH5_06009 [Leishmania sp. Ghana 2012 LV757]
MRSVQLSLACSCGLLLTSIDASPRFALPGHPIPASRIAVSALSCSRRWHTAAAAPNVGHVTPALRRLPTATDAEAELQAWVKSAAGTSSSETSALALSGKSLVLCVTALQLHEAAAVTQASTKSSTRFTELVHPYLSALAMHIFTRCNSSGKPSAAAVLYADVESSHIRPESLRIAVQYLAHKAFRSSSSSSSPSVGDGESHVRCDTAAERAEALGAERDLELTLEATLALLAGHQISQVHLAAVAAKEVGTAAMTAAMVPHVESTCHYVSHVVALISKPLPSPSAADISFPPAKRDFWTQTAKQLTSELYVALLYAQSDCTDAQLIRQMFRGLLRRVYGAEGGKFGLSRSLHYMLTVAAPYLLKSFTVIMGILQQQQCAAAERAAAKAVAAASKEGSSVSARTYCSSTTASSSDSPRSKNSVCAKARGVVAAAAAPSSEKMHRATLLVLLVAGALYLVSSRTNPLSVAAPSSLSSQRTFATEEQSSDKEAMKMYTKLCAMAASATAPQLK